MENPALPFPGDTEDPGDYRVVLVVQQTSQYPGAALIIY